MWLVQMGTPYYRVTPGKMQRYPPTSPFIGGIAVKWCIWCHHTEYAIYQKFGMTHLMSCSRQCLFAKCLIGEAWHITPTLHMKGGHNQGLRPWLWVHKDFPVQKGYRFYVTHVCDYLIKWTELKSNCVHYLSAGLLSYSCRLLVACTTNPSYCP